ncbi:MAG: hypothetical protein ACK5L6_03930 [Anaerorhabdus sp.]|uniref:hypothetical protein n=1 Tax=Anaerorhabdus sp. TaxID=1872524 RepID=UPI003A87A23D
MKANELYKITKSLMFEKSSSKDYDNYYLANLNNLLVENFQLNNDILESRGLPVLENIPFIASGEDEVKYVDILCYDVLPKGLAAKFFIDDDLNKKGDFYTSYLNAKIEASILVPTTVKDVFEV